MNAPLPQARVAVITRTKDRPLLLERAMRSVVEQTHRDLIWVVVNDGGQKSHVEATIATAGKLGIKAIPIHHDVSLGMQAASNAGIAACRTEFVVVHDDDDSWEPTFLAETVAYLDAKPHYGGVVTDTVRIDEEIVEKSSGAQTVVETSRAPYNPHLRSIHLSEMAEQNQFAPIAFLFRREVLDAVGPFDRSLTNLGDWEFNLRFLARSDIGMLDRPLAKYHWRVKATGNDGNSVADGASRHVEMDARIRNKLLRQDLADGTIGLGHLVAAGRARIAARGDLNHATAPLHRPVCSGKAKLARRVVSFLRKAGSRPGAAEIAG